MASLRETSKRLAAFAEEDADALSGDREERSAEKKGAGEDEESEEEGQERRETRNLEERKRSTTNSSTDVTGFVFQEYSNTSILECRSQCTSAACDFYAYDITVDKSRLCTLHWLVEGSWEQLYIDALEANIP